MTIGLSGMYWILASSGVDSFKPSCDSDYPATQQVLKDSRAQLWGFLFSPLTVFFPPKVIAWNPKVLYTIDIQMILKIINTALTYPLSSRFLYSIKILNLFFGGLMITENCNMSKKDL